MSYIRNAPPPIDPWNVEEFYPMPKSEYDGIEPIRISSPSSTSKKQSTKKTEGAAAVERYRRGRKENEERLSAEKLSLEAKLIKLQAKIALVRAENARLEAYRQQQRAFLLTVPFLPKEEPVQQQFLRI